MCNVKLEKWSNLKATFAAEMLRGEFPKCGIKYTGKHSEGLVLVKYDVNDKELIRQKAKAANEDSSYVFIIPKRIAEVYNI